jgi:hypothetical protein
VGEQSLRQLGLQRSQVHGFLTYVVCGKRSDKVVNRQAHDEVKKGGGGCGEMFGCVSGRAHCYTGET